MTKVVGVRFKQAGKIYDFLPGELKIVPGDHVIVETARGLEYGTVVTGERDSTREDKDHPLKEIIRVATDEDRAHLEDNKKREVEALSICLDKIKKHELEMKLIDCEYTFDNSKILFYFTADGRVDFRELVKELASVFHTRIELRQEGVRDETRALGGYGCCGRELCCHAYLADFVPVSIKMAKHQNLSLSASKISGVCGRLMCCLKYEDEVYQELMEKLPGVGTKCVTPEGLGGTVQAVSALRQKVKLLVDIGNDEKEIREYDASELVFAKRGRGQHRDDATREAQETAEDPDEAEILEEIEDEGHADGQRHGSRHRRSRGQAKPKRKDS